MNNPQHSDTIRQINYQADSPLLMVPINHTDEMQFVCVCVRAVCVSVVIFSTNLANHHTCVTNHALCVLRLHIRDGQCSGNVTLVLGWVHPCVFVHAHVNHSTYRVLIWCQV